MNRKEYIKPIITVVEVEIESALMDFSQTDPNRPGQSGSNPDIQEPGHELEGKEDNSSDLWGSEW